MSKYHKVTYANPSQKHFTIAGVRVKIVRTKIYLTEKFVNNL